MRISILINLTIVAALFSNVAYGQFFPTGSTWYYDDEPQYFGDNYGQARLSIKKEDLKGSTLLIHFGTDNLQVIPNQSNGSEDSTLQKDSFTFKVIDSIVYDPHNRIWFNYKLQKNDTIQFNRISYGPDTNVTFSVDSIFYNSLKQKCWALSFVGDSISIGRQATFEKVHYWQIIFNEHIGFVSVAFDIDNLGNTAGGFASVESFMPYNYWTFIEYYHHRYTFHCYKNWQSGHTVPQDCNSEFISVAENSTIAINTKYAGQNLKIGLPVGSEGLLQVFTFTGQQRYIDNVAPDKRHFHYALTGQAVIVVFTNAHGIWSKKLVVH